MANIVFARTDDPNSKAIKDGQLVFDTSGNGKMYLDNGTERLEMGGSMSVDSVLNAESTNPIQNKAVAGVMLKTLDEVGAVTKAGFIPDALTVKQLNSNLMAIELSEISFSNTFGTVESYQAFKIDKMCIINATIIGSVSASRWIEFAIIGCKAKNSVQVSAINVQNGSHGGMVRIEENTNILKVYCPSAVTNGFAFLIVFETI